MKSFTTYDVFSVIDADNAERFIGEPGYFGTSLYQLHNEVQSESNQEVLGTVLPETCANRFRPKDSPVAYLLFIPASRVIEI